MPRHLGVALALALAAAPAPSASEAVRVRCTLVYDGDTVQVRLPDGRLERVRYAGIDAPEREAPGAERARALNRVLVLGRDVDLRPVAAARDRFGRLLAHPSVCGIDVEAALLAAGLARRWEPSPPADFQ